MGTVYSLNALLFVLISISQVWLHIELLLLLLVDTILASDVTETFFLSI